MILFREHRGMLKDSMKTVVEINSLKELRDYINQKIKVLNQDDEIKVSFYSYDERVEWNTYLVTLNGCAIGFTNGELS